MCGGGEAGAAGRALGPGTAPALPLPARSPHREFLWGGLFLLIFFFTELRGFGVVFFFLYFGGENK